jgi:hypothetical protein
MRAERRRPARLSHGPSFPYTRPMHGPVIRPASEADSSALVELERLCPQGTHLRMYSEREDYFLRSRMYGDAHTLVAEDRERGLLFGVLAAAMKRLSIAGQVRPAAFFYDLRIHPEYRQTARGRHMLAAWKAMEAWAAGRGAHVVYGLIKKDNAPMLALVDRRLGYDFAGGMMIRSRPVFRRARVRCAPDEVGADDPRLVAATRARGSGRDFFPDEFRDTLLTPPMRDSGLFSFHRLARAGSWASIGFFRSCRVQRTRVLTIPPLYGIAGPLFSALQPLVPLPRIPREGGCIGYCHVFNHHAEGPEGPRLWRELIAWANNAALEEGAELLTGAFDPLDVEDRFHAEFRRGAITSIEYRLGMKVLVPGIPAGPFRFYPDVRDMN